MNSLFIPFLSQLERSTEVEVARIYIQPYEVETQWEHMGKTSEANWEKPVR